MTDIKTIILAGGCFWGLQDLLRDIPGVTATRVGYAGGTLDNPTYNDMKTGKTGHAEAVRVSYDAMRLPTESLMAAFFQMHDPTTRNRQGNDVGSQYRSVIFYTDETQKKAAEDFIARANASGRWPGDIVTELHPAPVFYDAEDYHQDYLRKNPGGYTCHWIRPEWIA